MTFTSAEAAAVHQALSDLRDGGWDSGRSDTGSPSWTIERPIATGGQWRLTHTALGAQGNTIVAARLAHAFHGRTGPAPNFVVFYGCAGAVDANKVGSVYLVAETAYLSLGTVKPAASAGDSDGPVGEIVTLKNKWICPQIDDSDVRSLDRWTFPLVGGQTSRNLLAETNLPPARVLATDAVIHVLPGVPPPPEALSFPPRWQKGEWTYGQAMAHVIDNTAGMDVLVEMESYGIAATTRALGLGEKVVVMRITTDALGNKKETDAGQGGLLMQGRLALLLLLDVLFDPQDATL